MSMLRSCGAGSLRPLGVFWGCGLCLFERKGTTCKTDVWVLSWTGAFGVVLGLGLALSNLEAGPREARAGFGAFIWTRVCSPPPQNTVRMRTHLQTLLCVLKFKQVGTCLWLSLWRVFFLLARRKKAALLRWWCFGCRWWPVNDGSKFSVVSCGDFSSHFSFC